MILADGDIKKALKKKHLIIDPPPTEASYASTSVDLTLDPRLRIFRTGTGVIIDPGDPGYKITKILEGVTEAKEISDDGYEIPPHTLVLGWTRERVELNLAGKIAARVEGKSSLARLGLGIHVTAPTIHAGFVGTIQLEMINHGPMKIKLRPKMAICQLIIECTKDKPQKAYSGQFAGQKTR